jgi:hypothetical protein
MPTSLLSELALRPPGTLILITNDRFISSEKYCMCHVAFCPRFFPRGYPPGDYLDATTTLTQGVPL